MPVPQFLDFLSEVNGRPVMPNVYSPENLLASLRKLTTNFDLVDTSGCPDPSVVVWKGMNSNRPWGYIKRTTLETE
ncbi:hypothetical protein CY34DRAFT_336604 [Suillus luteus UH-Slu-Lm8-n1]|uniref:Uncharacterized protein n=1 Tax=Suillus luteus UH-Slu-Lm8-n1 TaxID=930992 RepID=A0A0D0B6B8_9AGAM|nr:hypothetical protein CY34DRAFT_336604 [Suillus luteus UH-Slu-Lm8-n1]